MMLPLLAIVAALGQQPGHAGVPSPQQRAEAFDSAKGIVSAVGLRIADVRSALELFRRAVFNSPDGEVLSTASAFRLRCRALDSVAVAGARRMCRSCGLAEVEVALRGYRDVLPAVGRVGARCADQLARLSRGSDAAKQLRREVRTVGNAIVVGLVPYERRLEVLRVAVGWASPRGRAQPVPRPPR
jgi:hypothetical protein